MTQKTGIAIVGLGMALEPHLKSLADLSDRVEVIGAFSRSEQRRQAFTRRTGFAATGDLNALIESDAVDAALVLTPPATHLDIAGRFLDAGKDVLVEKPLEVSTAQAERLVDLARSRGRRLGVVLQHRFRNSSLALRKLIDGGSLGPLAAATCRVPWWRPQGYYDEPGRGTMERDGGGVLMTQAIHSLDLFRSLVGGIDRVAGVAATTPVHTMETEDFVAAALVMKGGFPGSLSATTAAYPGFPEEITLIFEGATAVLGGGRLDLNWHDGHAERIVDGSASGGGPDPMDFPHDAHRELLRDFLDARDRDYNPTVDGLEALRTQDLIDALLISARDGRWTDIATR